MATWFLKRTVLAGPVPGSKVPRELLEAGHSGLGPSAPAFVLLGYSQAPEGSMRKESPHIWKVV